MKNLKKVICNFIKTPTTGALMISGNWGCGKTYHIEHEVFPELIKKRYIPIRVSLFGMSNINELPARIIGNYADSDIDFQSKKKLIASKVIVKGAKFLSALKNDYVDINTLFESTNSFWYRFLPNDKAIIVLDDLERTTESINIQLLLGTINDLIEQRKYKIIIISNNDYLEKNNLIFKEKVIEKTIVYEPNIVEIYKTLISQGNYINDYKEFMLNSDCISIINPDNDTYKSPTVKKDLRNIRILKFTIEHFYKVFSCIWQKQKNKSDEFFIIFLKSLWAWTVGLSIGYKKNMITDRDKKAYSDFVEIPTYIFERNENDSINELFESEEEQQQKQQNISSSETMRYLYKTYIKCHNLPIVTSIDLFDLITAEYSIENKELLKTWQDFKEKAMQSKISPAYILLDNFIKAVWTFKNDEMPQKLNELASYVENGEFKDNLSYVNAATYLLHYQMLTNYSMEEMQNIIKKGIDKMYSKITKIQPLMGNDLNLLEPDIPSISRWVIQYERDKMKSLNKKNKSKSIEELIELFKINIVDFSKRLIPNYGNNETVDFITEPILSYIPKEIIVEKMQYIEPNEVMSLQSIINYRFNKLSSDECKAQEFTFIEHVVEGISKRDLNKKLLTDFIIEDQLNQTIESIKTDNNIQKAFQDYLQRKK